LFLKYFLNLLLVNLLLLVSLEKKFIYKELNYFLKVRNNILKENNLVNKNIRNIFVLL